MKTKVLLILAAWVLCLAPRVAAQGQDAGEKVYYQFYVAEWTKTPKRYVYPVAKMTRDRVEYEVQAQVTYNYDAENTRYERAELTLFVKPNRFVYTSLPDDKKDDALYNLKLYQNHNTVITQELFRLSGQQQTFEGEAEMYICTFNAGRAQKGDRVKLKYFVSFDPFNPKGCFGMYQLVQGDWEKCDAIVQMPRTHDDIWAYTSPTSQYLPESKDDAASGSSRPCLETDLSLREYTPDGALWSGDGASASPYPKHFFATIDMYQSVRDKYGTSSSQMRNPVNDVIYDSVDDTYSGYMSKPGSDQLVIRRCVPLKAMEPVYFGRRDFMVDLYIRVKFRHSRRTVDGRKINIMLPAQSVFTSEVIIPRD